MADRVCDENAEPDVTETRLPRRSSILKPVRPVLESVENATEDLTERRRLSKRVSFSDTHQINKEPRLFKCEISDEHCSGGESASQAGLVFLPGNTTQSDHAVEDPVGEAVQLLQFHHTPLEQSFYLTANEGSGSTEAASPTKTTSVLMEEAHSCLVFTQHGNISEALDVSSYQPFLDGTLGHGTMDITCGGTVNQTVAEATKTMLDNKTMETTCIETASHNQSALASFKTTLGDRSMDMTRVCGTSVLEQTITSTHRAHVVSDTGMDVAVGPQDMVTSGDATVRLQQTMNMTCPVGSTSFATGASDEVDAGAIPSGEAAKGNCAIASPSGTFDIAAFVASNRKHDCAELLGSKPGELESGHTDTSPATAAQKTEPFNLAAFVSLNRRNDPSEIIGKGAKCISEPASTQPALVPRDTSISDQGNGDMKGAMKEIDTPGVVCTNGNLTSVTGQFDIAAFVATNRRNDVCMLMGGHAEFTGMTPMLPGPRAPAFHSATSFRAGYKSAQKFTREADNTHLSSMETSATTDYRAVTMNVTDLDMTTGPAVDIGTESSELALTLQNRSIMTDVMSMTCADFPGPETTLNAVREPDNAHLSPMETSLATDYRVVTMNVTGLDITPEPAIHTGTESRVPAVTLQNRTVMTDVMSMTCTDLLGSEGIQNVARENNSTRLSPMQTSVATDCQVVTMNVTGLNTTTGLTVGAETAPIATLQDRTLMTDIMSMTCADLLGSESIQNAAKKSNSTCLSPVQASLATDYQVVTTNVTGLNTTTGLTVGAETAPIATLQDRTVMTDVMNITCANLLGLEEPSRENHPCAKPAESTLHFRDGDLSAAMNITCPNTMECPSIDEGTTGPSTELNEQVYVSPGVVEKSHHVTGEHSLNQADSQVEELSVAAHSHVESNRDDDDASEHMRLDPRVSMISLNATARDKSGADFSRSMPFLHTPASFAASLDDSSEAVPQDLPVVCDVTAPSFLKATPEDKPAGNIRSVEWSTSPTTPTKGKSHTSVKDSARKQLSVQASPADVLKGKDSVAYQLLASPATKRSLQSVGPTRRATVAPPSIKKQNATLKVDLTAPANMFNSLTDSTVNVSNVSALLEMPTGYVSSLTLLDDMFSPERVGKGNTDARNESACGSKSLTKARQQMGSVSHSRLVCNQGQSITVSSEVKANLDKTIAREAADARQDQAVASHSSKKSSLAAVSSASITEFNRESLSKSLSTTRNKRPMGTLETVVGHCPQSEVTTSSPGISSRAASAADAQCVGASLLACENDESLPKRATLMASDAAIRDNSTLVAADVSVQERVTLVAGDASARKSETHIVNDAPIRKSATFVVSRARTRKSSTFLATSGNGARPSATFAVSPPDYSIVQINDGTTVDESNRDVPSSMKVHSSATTRVRSVKHSTAAVHQPENSCSYQGATVSRSRKRLQFAAVDLQTAQSTMEGTGLHANGCAEDGHENMPAVPVASKGLFDVSHIQALPNRGETSSHQLHATSCRVLQRSTGSRVDDGDMLTDVPEPFLVGNNSTTSSSADSQHPSRSFETASQQTCHTQNSKPTGAVLESPDANVCIPTNMFYSSSSKKRSRLPSTPSVRSSEKCRSTAKRRPKQAAAKSSGSKRHICSPVPTSTKRRRPLQKANGKAESGRKAAVSATSASKTRQRIEQAGSSVMDILRSVFSYQPKLRSLPPSPVTSSTPTNASSPPVELPDSSVLLEEFNVPDDLSPQSTLKALDAVQARITRRLGEIAGSRAEGNPSSSVKDCVVTDIPPYELSDPQLDLTANIDILGIIDRLDDTNIRETLYWSFYNIPEETRKHWELYECVLEADRAAFGFIKGRVKLLVWLGDYVKLPNSGDRLTLARAAASGEVRHRAKVITKLRYKVTCRRKAQFNQYILQRLQDQHKADELLKKYPTTDCLGKLLEELGRFIVRYRPLSRDIAIIASDHRHTFRHPVLSYQIVAPSRLIWFHLDLPIDVDMYPNAVIVPSMRPYSDEYGVITTEKLRRITARVEPGPEYIVRLVDEIDDFLKK